MSSLRAPRPKGRVGPAPAVTLPAGSATAECAQPPALVYVLVVLLAPQILSGTHCPAPLRRQCAPLGSAPLSTIYHWCTRDYRAIVVLIWCANLGIIPWGKRMALAFTLRCPSRRGGGGARRGGRATSCCCRRTAQLMEDVEGLKADVLSTFLCEAAQDRKSGCPGPGQKVFGKSCLWGRPTTCWADVSAGGVRRPNGSGRCLNFPARSCSQIVHKERLPWACGKCGGRLAHGGDQPKFLSVATMGTCAWRCAHESGRRGCARGRQGCTRLNKPQPAAAKLHHPRPQGCTRLQSLNQQLNKLHGLQVCVHLGIRNSGSHIPGRFDGWSCSRGDIETRRCRTTKGACLGNVGICPILQRSGESPRI